MKTPEEMTGLGMMEQARLNSRAFVSSVNIPAGGREVGKPDRETNITFWRQSE